MEKKTVYGWEVWQSGNMLSTSRGSTVYESEEEAEKEARMFGVKEIIDDWKSENAYDGETEDDFEIRVFEDEEDEIWGEEDEEEE